MRELLEKLIAEHSGKTPEEVNLDIERDKILTSDAALGVRPDRLDPGVPQGRLDRGRVARHRVVVSSPEERDLGVRSRGLSSSTVLIEMHVGPRSDPEMGVVASGTDR